MPCRAIRLPHKRALMLASDPRLSDNVPYYCRARYVTRDTRVTGIYVRGYDDGHRRSSSTGSRDVVLTRGDDRWLCIIARNCSPRHSSRASPLHWYSWYSSGVRRLTLAIVTYPLASYRPYSTRNSSVIPSHEAFGSDLRRSVEPDVLTAKEVLVSLYLLPLNASADCADC